MLRRSMQLLVAEEINKTGMMTNISDAIHHMNNNLNYGVCKEQRNNKDHDSYTLVTVSFFQEGAAIFRINDVTEDVELWSKIGKW